MIVFMTSNGKPIRGEMVDKYLKSLIGKFFKILPIKEKEDSTLVTYMSNFQAELLGFTALLPVASCDGNFVTLLSILQFLIDHQEITADQLRGHVFRAISISKHLIELYGNSEGGDEHGSME